MDEIIGNKSLLMMTKNVLMFNINLQYGYINKPDIDDIFNRQWVSLDILTNKNISINFDNDRMPPLKSFKDLTDSDHI